VNWRSLEFYTTQIYIICGYQWHLRCAESDIFHAQQRQGAGSLVVGSGHRNAFALAALHWEPRLWRWDHRTGGFYFSNLCERLPEGSSKCNAPMILHYLTLSYIILHYLTLSYTILHVIHFELHMGVVRKWDTSNNPKFCIIILPLKMPFSEHALFNKAIWNTSGHQPESRTQQLVFSLRIWYILRRVNDKLNLCMNSKQFFELSQYIIIIIIVIIITIMYQWYMSIYVSWCVATSMPNLNVTDICTEGISWYFHKIHVLYTYIILYTYILKM